MKKYTAILALVLNLVIINNAYSWGDKGHKLITEKCFAFLPAEMQDFAKLKDLIIQHSIDPDERKDEDPTEGPRHYIDINFYPHFLRGQVILSLDSIKTIYGDSTTLQMGYLPWATYDTYKKLVDAFKNDDKDKITLYAADLAHYVGDGFQPLHACMNYNGQLSNQKGIHSRYEIKMIDLHLSELRSENINASVSLLENIPQRIFNYTTGSSIYSSVILDADHFCTTTGFYYNEDKFYDLLWFRTKYLTIQQMNSSALELASLYYTAWVNAGKPELPNL